MIQLADIEHEYYPDGGDMGRGVLLPQSEIKSLDTRGYTPFLSPWSHTNEFPVWGCSGAPTNRMWRGWVREQDGKHFVAAVEFNVTYDPLFSATI